MENDRQPRLSLVGIAHQGAAFGILERSKALPILHNCPSYTKDPLISGLPQTLDAPFAFSD